MGNSIMVSVICNTYNHEKYIKDALEGFVSQKTNFPFEVLIHDDASTDGTAAIIREYEEKYPQIIKPIYQTENQYSKNVPISRIFQAPRIQGKYTAFCEGDDFWSDPGKLQKQVDFLEGHPEYSLCCCSTDWLDMRTGKVTNACKIEADRDISLEEIILEKRGRVFQYATMMVRSELYKQIPAWMTKYPVGDTPLAMHAATNGKIRMFTETMAVYRNHVEGAWTSRYSKDTSFRIRTITRMIEGLEAFNAATEYQYNAVVTERVLQNRYKLARTKRDLKAMCTGELRRIHLSKSIPARISDVVFCVSPGLHGLLIGILRK